jgi:type IV pilus assembly protein PilW
MRRTINPIGSRQHGITLVELMVALAIGSFLMIGAIQIYSQSRQAFVINESIARVQETAQFALDTIEADLRMASNWGRTSRALSIEGRSMIGVPNPKTLAVPLDCGEDWSIELGTPVDGFDNVVGGNNIGLPCPPREVPQNTGQANSDVLIVRRASVNSVLPQIGRLQIQTTRIQGEIFDDGNIPPQFDPDPTQSATHNLMVSSYYVDTDSELIPGVPTLRRKVLGIQGVNSRIFDQEIAPGVENLQIQFGIDMNEDNTVDRYVNPGDENGEGLAGRAGADSRRWHRRSTGLHAGQCQSRHVQRRSTPHAGIEDDSPAQHQDLRQKTNHDHADELQEAIGRGAHRWPAIARRYHGAGCLRHEYGYHRARNGA